METIKVTPENLSAAKELFGLTDQEADTLLKKGLNSEVVNKKKDKLMKKISLIGKITGDGDFIEKGVTTPDSSKEGKEEGKNEAITSKEITSQIENLLEKAVKGPLEGLNKTLSSVIDRVGALEKKSTKGKDPDLEEEIEEDQKPGSVEGLLKKGLEDFDKKLNNKLEELSKKIDNQPVPPKSIPSNASFLEKAFQGNEEQKKKFENVKFLSTQNRAHRKEIKEFLSKGLKAELDSGKKGPYFDFAPKFDAGNLQFPKQILEDLNKEELVITNQAV